MKIIDLNMRMRPLALSEDQSYRMPRMLAELWPIAAIGLGCVLTLAWCLGLAWAALALVGAI
ncbi:hypothetical protein [Salinarimonas soli]|uniref:Uncharacterized protein n=1 Tax=Salinarimonas soli TaxID=1638099 RepID=A0A5B2VDV5_9HYPH|nr:hypothetical protein [Salinarimonas soli]KAA2236908.1 hypothetical protein F0L46_13035 [Salinarimonas soli]